MAQVNLEREPTELWFMQNATEEPDNSFSSESSRVVVVGIFIGSMGDS